MTTAVAGQLCTVQLPGGGVQQAQRTSTAVQQQKALTDAQIDDLFREAAKL
jgi:hypothetical protein